MKIFTLLLFTVIMLSVPAVSHAMLKRTAIAFSLSEPSIVALKTEPCLQAKTQKARNTGVVDTKNKDKKRPEKECREG